MGEVKSGELRVESGEPKAESGGQRAEGSDASTSSACKELETSVRTVALKRPITFEGREIKEIRLDFDKLNGDTLIRIEKQYIADNRGTAAGASVAQQGYCAYVAAFAAGEPVDTIKKLGAADFNEVVGEVQSFFWGLDTTQI